MRRAGNDCLPGVILSTGIACAARACPRKRACWQCNWWRRLDCRPTIPDLRRAFFARKHCLIRNPTATRTWQFVLEPLRGFLMLAERLATDAGFYASGWNFGPAGDDNQGIADELVRLWGDP